MCDYLNKTNATYYFRRAVPDDLVAMFKTQRGNPRSEWKISLRTKDREDAKRLRLVYITQTDEWIDEARRELALADEPAGGTLEPGASVQEEREARAAEEAAKLDRFNDRRPYRIVARQRMMLSTAALTPEEAAWRDLVREGADPETIAQATAAQQMANDALVIRMGKGAA